MTSHNHIPRLILNTAAALALVLLPAIVPRTKAMDFQQSTYVTFSGTVELPGMTLPAGTYMFKTVPYEPKVMTVWNEKQDHCYGMFLTREIYSINRPLNTTRATFAERAAGSPPAVRTYTYLQREHGHEFMYPRHLPHLNTDAVVSGE